MTPHEDLISLTLNDSDAEDSLHTDLRNTPPETTQTQVRQGPPVCDGKFKDDHQNPCSLNVMSQMRSACLVPPHFVRHGMKTLVVRSDLSPVQRIRPQCSTYPVQHISRHLSLGIGFHLSACLKTDGDYFTPSTLYRKNSLWTGFSLIVHVFLCLCNDCLSREGGGTSTTKSEPQTNTSWAHSSNVLLSPFPATLPVPQ